MKNKKGFTLIELLAILIILSIIALITFPIVNKLLAEQDKNTFKVSVEGLVRTIETDRADNAFMNYLKYVYQNETLTLVEQNFTPLSSPREISHSGKIDGGSGTFYIDGNGNIYGSVFNGVMCAFKDIKKEVVISEGECLDLTPPQEP